MPSVKANPHEFESLEYIRLVARVNEVMSACLGLPLDPEDGAAKYERAAVALSSPTVWPDDVVERAQPFVTDFPWLLPLFKRRTPGSKCPVWEQVPDDLTPPGAFSQEIEGRVRNHKFLRRHVAEPATAYLEVITDAARIIIGKAAYLRDKAEKRADCNWLLEAFGYGQRAFLQYIVVITTGESKLPGRDKTVADADYTPPSEKPNRPRIHALTDLQGPDDGTLGEEIFRGGEQPSPETLAIHAELRDDIDKLPPREKRVIHLRWDEEKTWPETAAAMGCSVYQAQQYHHFALKKLRRGRTDD